MLSGSMLCDTSLLSLSFVCLLISFFLIVGGRKRFSDTISFYFSNEMMKS